MNRSWDEFVSRRFHIYLYVLCLLHCGFLRFNYVPLGEYCPLEIIQIAAQVVADAKGITTLLKGFLVR